MPSRFRVRRIFKGLVVAIAKPLASRGVRPDTITYVSLLLAFLAAIGLNMTGSALLFGILVFLSGLFDGVDGTVARELNIASDSGAFIDSVIDKISEGLILGSLAVEYLTITFLGLPVSLWVLVAITGWLLTSYTRARATSLGVLDLDIGVGGRSERLFTLVIFSVIDMLLWGLIIVTLMGLLTAGYRFYHYSAQLSKRQTE
ncbi:MAG: CDP-alcohol phosphatidyltransferase family protein [Candidatus Thorarchaeota archaeon]